MPKIILVLIAILLMTAATIYAQESPICPPDVLLALARSGSACYGLGLNEACIGNGTVESGFFVGQSGAFAKPGDKTSLGVLQTVAVRPIEEGISTAALFAQADLTETEERGVMLFLFGDTSIENRVPPLVEIIGYAKGTLNIRRTPELQTEIIMREEIGRSVIVNGRSDDSGWLRVQIPNSNDLGWASADVVDLQGDPSTLAVATSDTRVYRPFQLFNLHTGDAALCGGALGSGLLLQTPNTTSPVLMTINGVEARLAGTFLLTANGALTIHVLDGEAELTASSATTFVPAGARVQVELGGDGMPINPPTPPEPYDFDRLAALPINNLPSRVQIAPALTHDEIAQKQAEHAAAIVEATAEPESVSVDTSCRRLVKRDTTLWAGPGLFYEAINEIEAETPVQPVLQTVDASGHIWWQLRSSNWIQAGQVEQTGECEDVPVTTVVKAPPNNTLSLETCQTTNGPLRAGQDVIIQFIPPAWDNYGEARDAVYIDPGRITVGSQTYWTYATDPIRLGTEGERYLRRFFIYWDAVPGTFRIVGERLHYTPICTITVPVE